MRRESILPETGRRAEHVRVRIVLQLVASRAERGDEPFRAGVDALLLAGELLPFRLHLDHEQLTRAGRRP